VEILILVSMKHSCGVPKPIAPLLNQEFWGTLSNYGPLRGTRLTLHSLYLTCRSRILIVSQKAVATIPIKETKQVE
jgi:hypothetical protein